MDYSIKIGGEAGQGIQTIGETLALVFSRSGYHVFTNQDYDSRIRGGHNYFQIRFSEDPVMSPRTEINILVVLDIESIRQHEGELSENGRIIYDSASLKEKHEKPNFLDVPFTALAIEHGGNKIMANTVATGAVLGMLGIDIDILLELIKKTFGRKGEEIIAANINSAKAGYEFAVKNCDKCNLTVIKPSGGQLSLTNGTDAIGLGAISAGCKFYAAYPMTPSTGILDFMASHAKDYGIVVEQAEDEIAAINMTIGASYAGVRAMTSTSGGGFALMVEGLSLAGMTETPVVIGFGQRPGPATGLPTRTEQADLQFVLYSAHGEFPRVVFAPGSPEQAFYLTNKAFDIAEKYQVPAFIMFDTHLADAEWTFKEFDMDKITYNDYRLRGDAFSKLTEYKRHALTDNGISPLGIPGESRHTVVTDSDEHDEEGHIAEVAGNRTAMVNKRLSKKLPLIRQEIGPPLLYGSNSPEVVITGWGSNYGVMKESVDKLSAGRKIAMLHFSEIYPFPSIDKFDYLKVLNDARLTICIENNATGQFARLMRAETGYEFKTAINRFDGRPFTLDGLSGEIDVILGRL